MCSQAGATAQASDYFLYKDEILLLHVNPQEQLFRERKELRLKSNVFSTGNGRGYIATFLVEKDALYISWITIQKRDLEKKRSSLEVSVLDEVFPTKEERKIAWYFGLLVAPKGKITGYVHFSYASQYEGYILERLERYFEFGLGGPMAAGESVYIP